jgi:TolA-binding protein
MHRTESSSSSAADSKYAKSDLNDFQDNIERSHNETTERLKSMENAITELQSKIVQMEECTNSQLKNKKDVRSLLFLRNIVIFNIYIGK